MSARGPIVIVTPNTSEQMGGEAIKAFQFVKKLHADGERVRLITHARCRDELTASLPEIPITYIEDDPVQFALWKSKVFENLVDLVFYLKVRDHIERIYREEPDAVFHYLCPVSPILPRFPKRGPKTVLGPLTGNIYYPPAFRDEEPATHRRRRVTHYALQRACSVVFGDKKVFDKILVSGGERTRESLSWAGCPDHNMIDVVDSGISEKIRSVPVIQHEGQNFKFISTGRMDPHKGIDLSITALEHTKQPITLDIVGRGKEEERLKALVAERGLHNRVRFLGWLESHDALIELMTGYRGYVFPSLAEANGIVVQEAMMLGLPVICLKWGGPTMLADDDSACLVEPRSRDYVVREIAAAMDRLATEPDTANRIVQNARAIASRRFSWDQAIDGWKQAYA